MLRENDWKKSRSLVVERIEEEGETVVDAEKRELPPVAAGLSFP